MKSILDFINSFLGRAGSFVFSSVVISRLLSFFASWIALQLIPKNDLGIVIYAFQIVAFIVPVSGFGLHQSLIRYGAKLDTVEEKNELFKYAFQKGFIASLILIVGFVSFSVFNDFKIQGTSFYLGLLSISFITHYFFELVKIQFRLQKRNKLYSYTDITYNVLFVSAVFILSYFFQELGYAIAIISIPLLTALIFLPKLGIKWNQKQSLNIMNKGFWSYGFFASLSNVTTQLLISIDIILIGNILLNTELVTAFKYVSIVPYSLLFLSQVVIITDFVNFTEKINQRKYILDYISNYIKILTVISLVSLGFIYFLGEYILAIFNPEYVAYYNSLLMLTIGVCGILILRGLFGNLLSSLGKAHVNFFITGVAVVLNIVLNYQLIPKLELFGASITSAILMWFTGILSAILFFYYFKKELNGKTKIDDIA